jgi:hypothetical protein
MSIKLPMYLFMCIGNFMYMSIRKSFPFHFLCGPISYTFLFSYFPTHTTDTKKYRIGGGRWGRRRGGGGCLLYTAAAKLSAHKTSQHTKEKKEKKLCT